MIHSMTAFARESTATDQGVLTVELRSVNHRYLDCTFKLPDALRPLEPRLREMTAAAMARGKLDVLVRLQGHPAQLGEIKVNALQLDKLGEFTINIDCDVIQADGGTRTAAITGACVALVDAINHLQRQKLITQDPLLQMVASVSVGVYQGVPVLDLDYPEDSAADTDMNVVMGESGAFIEVQGTAEGAPFGREELNSMLDLASDGIQELIELQKTALAG